MLSTTRTHASLLRGPTWLQSTFVDEQAAGRSCSGGDNTSTASNGNPNTSSGGMTEADYWNSPAPSIATQYVDTYGGQVSNTSFVDSNTDPVDAGSGSDGDVELGNDGGGGGAVDAHEDTASTGTQPYVQTALDDDGNVNPGVSDPNASPEQQYQQLQDRLIAQGISPQQAQDIADEWLVQGGGISTQPLPSANNTSGQSSSPTENAQASPVLNNLRVTVLGGMRFYQWEDEDGQTLTSNIDPRSRDFTDPVPGSNHAEVSAAANARNTAIGQVMTEAQAQADAEAARLQMRQGIPGVLRGLNQAGVETVYMPHDVYVSLRDQGLLQTGLNIVNGMVELPGTVWDAIQSGDTQTLAAATVGAFIGPRGNRGSTGGVQATPSRPAVTSGGIANVTTGSQLQADLANRALVRPDTSNDAAYQAATNQSVLTSNNFDMNHVLSGEVNASGRATGYHAEFAAEGGARITPGATVTQNLNGTYEAPVQVWDTNTNQWIDKNTPSTFFPPSWSEARIAYEVSEAFRIAGPKANLPGIFGTSPSGIEIRFYWDSKNQRTTFYPLGN